MIRVFRASYLPTATLCLIFFWATGGITLSATAQSKTSGSSTYSETAILAPAIASGSTLCTNPNPNPNPNPESFASPGDFNGDCKSDLLWQNGTTGLLYVWFMDGTTIASQLSPGTVSSPWGVKGMGDFDGDGKADILWQNSATGQLYIWFMNGTTITSQLSPGTVSSPWGIRGIGDFDGDGKADILWQNSTTGQLYIWFMSGSTIASEISPGTVSSDWSIQGVGDFNGDGKADILWRGNSSGEVDIWLMNGATTLNRGAVFTPSSDWVIHGVGDFDGDGKSDVLWQNTTTGQVYIWLMNGGAIAGQGSPITLSSDWVFHGVGDFDGNGKSDVLWQNSTTGEVYIWLMSGTSIANQGSPLTVSGDWQVAPQSGSANINFGFLNIGTTSWTAPVAVTISKAGTLTSISARTKGITGLDFASTTGGSCRTANVYNVRDVCTVRVTFTPAQAGIRNGAVVLEDSENSAMGTAYLQGIGVGPQMTFLPGAESMVVLPTSAIVPSAVAVDGKGDVYIADVENNQVVKEILSAGQFSQSIVTTSALNNPSGIAIDGSGNIYVSDTLHNRVIVETPSAASYVESTVSTSTLNNPSGIAVDGNGNIYIADSGNNRVLVESYLNGVYTESTMTTSPLNDPSSVAVDGSGDVYILDTGNNRVLTEIPSNGSYSERTLATSALNFPTGITLDGIGDVYIIDAGNNRVLKESPAGGATYSESLIPTTALDFPFGIAVDGKDNVYVADTGNNRVLKEDFSDPPSLIFANTAPNTTSSDSPQTITVENVGNSVLDFPGPGSGNNPSISANFTLNSGGASACPLISAGGSGGTLAAGQACLLPINFTPAATGPLSGTLALTDNVLNAAAPGYTTQVIALSGLGTGVTTQTITFGSIPAQSAATTLALTATASSGLTVSFASTTPSVCLVSGFTASLLTAGTCSIQASQPGNGVYAAAAPVTQSLTVALSAQTITLNPIPNQVLNTSAPVILAAAASSGLPVEYTSTTSSVCTVSGASASLLNAGTCTIQASQPGDGVTYAAAATVTQSFNVATVTPGTATSLGAVNVGSSSSAVPVVVTISAAGIPERAVVLTDGVAGLDFASATGGSCTMGASYSVGDTCTLNVTFAPTVAGTRYGAVDLQDNAGNLLATAYVQGAGVGPQVVFLPGTEDVVSTDLSGPQGLVVDGGRNLYLTDTDNNRILKETYANGTFAESTISTSSLLYPSGVAIDGRGILYVLDSGNSRVLKEAPQTTGAYIESTVPTSVSSSPGGIAVDGNGDLYIADSGNNRILVETLSNGIYSETILPTSALIWPSAVAVDGSGNIYIADSANNRVLMETPSSGSYSESTLPTSALNWPSAIAVDNTGNIYIADSGNNRILKESLFGTSYTESAIPSSGLNYPIGVALDSSGNIYIADTYNNRVLREDFGDPPSLTFLPTPPNTTSADSPQVVIFENIGNAPLTLPVPGSDSNPNISSNFTLNSTGGSACPLVSAGDSRPGTLAAGMSCILPVSFTPSIAGTLSGSLALTDNALNAAAPRYATQVIALSGMGTGSTAQTITFGSISSQSAVTSLGLTATATSGLSVGFASGTPSVCSVSGVTASLLTAGICSITASQPGNSFYAPATPVTRSFAVNLAVQTITFSPVPNQILNTSAPVSLTATASSGLSVSFASTTPSVCTASGSSLSLLTAGTCTIQASQSGNGVTYAAAANVSQSFTVGTINPMTGTTFGSVNIGTSGSAVAVTVTLIRAGTLGSAVALTGGVTGLDFATAAGGSCTAGSSYNAGDTCTVNVTFAPTLSGIRYGAIVLQDGSGNLLATSYVQGTGIGPQLVFAPGGESAVPSSAGTPEGIAVDAGGSLYIVDATNGQVLKETLSAGSYSESTVTYVTSPSSVAVDASGAVYTADTGDSVILRDVPLGTGYSETAVPTSTLSGPKGVAVDGSGNVYIADTGNNRVLLEALSNGSYTESTIPTSQLNGPTSVAVDEIGDVYILDSGNNRVLEEALSNGGYSETTIPTSSLDGPTSVAIDADGNLYIADFGNNRLLKETPSSGSYVETTVSSSTLNLPYGVAVDSGGNVYISDTFGDRVLKEDFADSPSLSFLATAPNTTSSDSPQTVTVENVGNRVLTFPLPESGNNPNISANFALNTSVPSACPLLTAGGSGPGTLGIGQSCILLISFTPASSGDFSGTLSLADNALNGNATQTLQLSGTGTGSTAQTITFGSIPAESVNSTLALTATASSGLTVTFGSTTPSVCTLSGTTVSLLTAGTCSIQASQPGNNVYAAATPITQSFTVNLAAQTITFLSIPNQVANQSVGVVLTAAASSALPVRFASDTPSVCTVSGGTASLLTAGTCTIEANQAGDGIVYAPALTIAQSFAVETVNPVTGTSFGSVNIGATSSAVSVTMTVTAAGTLGSISALTHGVTGLDFASTTGGSCTTGTSYRIGDTCTANITFTPTLAGVRYGAVVLEDGSGDSIATAYIQGTGTGPQVNFLPGTETVVSSDLSGPQGIAVDGSGNLFFADTNNNRILKEVFASSSYTESIVATSSLLYPAAVTIDGSGVLYVLDSGNSRVLKETPAGGAYVESVLSTSSLSSPDGIAVDGSGNVYIADSGNNRVLLESLSDGTYAETTIPTSALSGPDGVAVDSFGNVYIADTGNNRVLRENLVSGAYDETTISTSPLSVPVQIALDSEGDIYIVDSSNYRVLKETPKGSSYTESTVATSALGWPFGIAADGSGNIYVADSGMNRLLKEDLADMPTLGFAATAPGSTSSDSPQMVTLQNYGNAALAFSTPASGNNPSISDGFTLDGTGASACPLISPGSPPGTLGAGQSCALPVSFAPSETGTFSGSLVISDNALNATTSQTIQLSGTGTNSNMAQHLQSQNDGDCVGVPTIVNVSPATWFAGKTYHITITGYNFLTAGVTCGANHSFLPTIVQVTGKTSSTGVINYQILNSSLIQATIQVGDQEPTATAQLTVFDFSLALGPIRSVLKVKTIDQEQYKASIAPIQILATPKIEWYGDTISNSVCTLTKQEILSDGASHCAVVGQRISLTTDVATGDGQGNTALPNGLSVTENDWAFDTLAIGGYIVVSAPIPPPPPAPSAPPNSSSGTVINLDANNLHNPTATAYWLFAPGGNKAYTARYHYCVQIPGGISPLDPPGNDCSGDASAEFNVSGPTVDKVAVSPITFTHFPNRYLGQMKWRIDFTANMSDATPPAAYSGSYFWVQVISDAVTKDYSNSPSKTCGVGPNALDGFFPIWPMLSGYFDAPRLTALDTATRVTTKASVRSYLMWTANSHPVTAVNQDSPFIPVPVGVVSWHFSGTMTKTATGEWNYSPGKSISGVFTPAVSEPTWKQYLVGDFLDTMCTAIK